MYTEIFYFITGIVNYSTFITNYLTDLVYSHTYNTILSQMICNTLTNCCHWLMNQNEDLCEGTLFWLFIKSSPLDGLTLIFKISTVDINLLVKMLHLTLKMNSILFCCSRYLLSMVIIVTMVSDTHYMGLPVSL
jgi:hypothetical protein